MQVGDTIEYKGEKYIVNAKLVMMEWLLCEHVGTRGSRVIRIGDYLVHEAERQRVLAEEAAKTATDPSVLGEIYGEGWG